jgi:UDP-4-amino-4,6-dideoxy-N-acetyl-beta-L-altrosamine transaminase
VSIFEEIVAGHVGAKYAVAANSATSALHIACMSLGLKSGDWLWTRPISFVASANCGLYCGAQIDFIDIDSRTYNICPEALESKLLAAEKTDTLPKIVIAVHLCGQSCEMTKIFALSQKYGFKIIEDASHAIGGRYQEEFIGNCRYSDITIFSFHAVKTITTAEGGMAMTNSDVLANQMRLFRSHGITRDPLEMTHDSDGLWYYQQIVLGYNYRMTELQAALGISQMKRLNDYVARRHEIASQYNKLLDHLPIIIPWQHPDNYSGMHLYVIRLRLDKVNYSHHQIFNSLRQKNIGVNLHYIPIHTQPYYQKMGFKRGDFPIAEAYYADAISLPMFPSLTQHDLEIVAKSISESIENI